LTLGSGIGAIIDYKSSFGQVSFSPSTQSSQLFSLTDFSFGVVNMTTGNGTFRSIINSDEALYGFSTNSTLITADFRGLGLPTTSYNVFTNLMDIISIGQANCLKTQGGLCVLPQTCDNYPALWTYSFRVQFFNTSEYLIVPLATFAANQNFMGNNATECVVYVENLDESLANSA
jgi:hypothetical protein